MRIALRRGGAWNANLGYEPGLGFGLGLGLGLGVVIGVAGCGRSDSVLYVDTDNEGTTFGYAETGETETDTDTDTDTDTEGSVCGDGVVDPDEQCDDQNTSNTDACTNGCSFNVCGDGFVFPELEQCDPGAADIGPNQACVPGCQFNVCGDGFEGPGEQCDDGNSNDGDGCNNDCTTGTCGNGIVDPGEECDDQNGDPNDGCLNTCVQASCGDGIIWSGVETCDDGPLNSNAAECTLACELNVCGDANLWEMVEECDPGADMIGPGMACLAGCVQNGCGDGDVGPTEQCDDQNADDTDDCTTQCELATCGDGFVWAGNEECDDANTNDNDACHNDCSQTVIAQVSVGGNHSCAMLDNGNLSCWGNGNNGRTGYASQDNIGDDEPAGTFGFVDTDGPVASVAATVAHTCVRYANNRVRCFGRASEGQLGYGNTDQIGDDEDPGSVGFLDLGGPATLLGSGGGSFHTCVVRLDGEVVCWGRDSDGRLGYAIGPLTENVGDDETPAEHVAEFGTVQVGGTVTQIVTGGAHTCALLDDATIRCWGSNANGQLGYGNNNNIGDDETPASAGQVSVGGAVTSLGTGWLHTCAVLDSGGVKCWGKGNDGRLGYGNVAWVGLNNTPSSVGLVDVGGVAVKVDGGIGHTCALLDDGTIRCWGWGARGQLGYGNVTNIGDNETPASAGPVEIGGIAIDIAVDGNVSCATRDDGRVLCWGEGSDGRLGYGNLDWIGDDEFPASAGVLPLF